MIIISLIAGYPPTGGYPNPRSRNLLQPNKSTPTPKRYNQGGGTLSGLKPRQISRTRVPPRGGGREEEEEEEEKEERLFKANAVNEEDPDRDRATPA